LAAIDSRSLAGQYHSPQSAILPDISCPLEQPTAPAAAPKLAACKFSSAVQAPGNSHSAAALLPPGAPSARSDPRGYDRFRAVLPAASGTHACACHPGDVAIRLPVGTRTAGPRGCGAARPSAACEKPRPRQASRRAFRVLMPAAAAVLGACNNAVTILLLRCSCAGGGFSSGVTSMRQSSNGLRHSVALPALLLRGCAPRRASALPGTGQSRPAAAAPSPVLPASAPRQPNRAGGFKGGGGLLPPPGTPEALNTPAKHPFLEPSPFFRFSYFLFFLKKREVPGGFYRH
jgi:hypothetical protein